MAKHFLITAFCACRKLCPYVGFAVSQYVFLLISLYTFCAISRGSRNLMGIFVAIP